MFTSHIKFVKIPLRWFCWGLSLSGQIFISQDDWKGFQNWSNCAICASNLQRLKFVGCVGLDEKALCLQVIWCKAPGKVWLGWGTHSSNLYQKEVLCLRDNQKMDNKMLTPNPVASEMMTIKRGSSVNH